MKLKKKMLKKTIAVNCKTEEDGKEYLALLHSLGYKRNMNGRDLLDKDTNWGSLKEKTCYYINASGITYCYHLKDDILLEYPRDKKKIFKGMGKQLPQDNKG